MSKFRRPPPLPERSVEDLTYISDNRSNEDIEIKKYIQSSPIVSEFRLSNPNLQPLEEYEKTCIEPSNNISTSSRNQHNPNRLSYTSTGSKSSLVDHDQQSQSQKRLSMNDATDIKKRSKMHRFSSQFKNLKISSHSSTLSSSASVSTLNSSVYNISPKGTYKANQVTPSISAASSATHEKSNFWKYHILKFGKDLYLTTNPDLKHVYCRNGPGYYVEVDFPKDLQPNKHQSKADRGFKLVFKDINDYQDVPIMTIIKENKNRGGNIIVSMRRRTYLTTSGELKTVDVEKRMIFDGFAKEKPMGVDKLVDTHDYKLNHFLNYEMRDFHNVNWKVGSIPKIKHSNRGKLKLKLDLASKGEDSYKYTGKKNVYFYGDNSQEQIVGLFRPNETRVKKKIIQTVNRNSNMITGSTRSYVSLDEDEVDLDLGSKSYYKSGDGLKQQNPADDAPNHHKLGWITLYEDEQLQNVGMFDLALGLTLAVGFAKIVEDIYDRTGDS